MIYSMSKDIVDNGKSDFVYVVYRSERYHSSWIGQGGCYPKVYIYTRRKDRSIVRVEGSVGIMPTYTGSGPCRSLQNTCYHILTTRQLLR